MMLKSCWIMAAALFACAGFAPTAAADPLELKGEVQRGDTVVHPFEHDGRKFELRLLPMGHGWSIWIGDPMYRDRNHVVVVTPPFSGVNPSVIQGWHFRNADNTGPNKPGEGKVDAPGKTRKFGVVLDGAGYQAAREALEILSMPDGKDKAEIRSAEKRLAALPTAGAVVEIEALELGNLVQGEQAWIQRMAFRLRIDLP